MTDESDYTAARAMRLRQVMDANDKQDLQDSAIVEFKDAVTQAKFWLSVSGMTATEIQQFLQGAIR